MIHFRSRLTSPLPIGSEGTLTIEDIENVRRNYESDNGGGYPIGINQTWHNGIHLVAPQATAVRAIADGTIVAARLPAQEDRKKFPLGSPAFVLIKHTLSIRDKTKQLKDINGISDYVEYYDHSKWTDVRAVDFYSLYMHIAYGSAGAMHRVPWMRTYVRYLSTSSPGENAYYLTHQCPMYREPYSVDSQWPLPIDILEAGDVIELLYEDKDPAAKSGKHPHGSKVGKWRKIRLLGPMKESLGQSSELWIFGNNSIMHELNAASETGNHLKEGRCVKLEYKVRSGETIGYTGDLLSSTDNEAHSKKHTGVHFEIFSEKCEINERAVNVLEDPNEDPFPEIGARFSSLSHIAWDTAPFASDSDISEFYRILGKECDTNASMIYKTVTRNRSYWSIDWSSVLQQSAEWANKYIFTDELANICNRYSWWNECAQVKASIPSRNHVYHYHPLFFMEYLIRHALPLPIFYTQAGQTETVVTRPADVHANGIKVMVYDGKGDDWVMGSKVSGGLFHGGTPQLDRALITHTHELELPELSEREKRIWASLWNSEGGFDAINSWDDCFLSVGCFQQTSGSHKDPGELQGFIYYLKKNNPSLYLQFFGQFHIDVTVPIEEDGILKGHFIIAHKTLNTAEDKQPLRDFYWAYRFINALRNRKVQKLFLGFGFNRLRLILRRNALINHENVTLESVFKSELALALCLDWHINRPHHVDGYAPAKQQPQWVTIAKEVLKARSPSTITLNDQDNLVRLLISHRNSSSMTNPEGRSKYIIHCVENLDDQLAKRIGFQNGLKDLHFSQDMKEHCYNFLKHELPNTLRVNICVETLPEGRGILGNHWNDRIWIGIRLLAEDGQTELYTERATFNQFVTEQQLIEINVDSSILQTAEFIELWIEPYGYAAIKHETSGIAVGRYRMHLIHLSAENIVLRIVSGVASFITEEINANRYHPDVSEIQKLLTEYRAGWKSVHAWMKACALWAYKVHANYQLKARFLRQDAKYVKNAGTEFMGHLGGGEWDHKPLIEKLWGNINRLGDTPDENVVYFSDIWSNLHYGYVGRYAGFTLSELIFGADLRNVLDNGAVDEVRVTEAIAEGYTLGAMAQIVRIEDILDIVQRKGANWWHHISNNKPRTQCFFCQR